MAAERLFDREGFRGTGVDRIVDAANVSTRTLYKHLGSKDRLAVAVLEARHARFLAALEGDDVAGLFRALDVWMAGEGARGCLFLRALGEYAAHEEAVRAAVRAHKAAMLGEIERRVAHELGRPDADLAARVLVLFEGAVATGAYRGREMVAVAAEAAAALLAAARQAG